MYCHGRVDDGNDVLGGDKEIREIRVIGGSILNILELVILHSLYPIPFTLIPYTLYPASPMKQTLAFKMKLKPGFEEEYKRRHDAIWPELKELLIESGVSDYSIFLDRETNILFAVQKVEGDRGSQDLGKNAIVKKWWAYMADIMDTNADFSPVTIPLQQVFHID